MGRSDLDLCRTSPVYLCNTDILVDSPPLETICRIISRYLMCASGSCACILAAAPIYNRKIGDFVELIVYDYELGVDYNPTVWNQMMIQIHELL